MEQLDLFHIFNSKKPNVKHKVKFLQAASDPIWGVWLWICSTSRCLDPGETPGNYSQDIFRAIEIHSPGELLWGHVAL